MCENWLEARQACKEGEGGFGQRRRDFQPGEEMCQGKGPEIQGTGPGQGCYNSLEV